MERYGSKEGTQSDPVTEWEAPKGETGLEESMWRLGLGPEPYPERPGEPDCIYYLRTGSCGYGDRCRFNHPRHRSPVSRGERVTVGDYPERTGQPVCQYYVKTGTCKFGSSCKYHHPRQGVGYVSSFASNIYGYPLRPGEKECSYYMKTGHCKFGMTCKFHHPQPANVQVPTATPVAVPPAPVASSAVYHPVQNAPAPDPVPAPLAPASQQYGMVTGNWPFVRPSMVPNSYVLGPYGPLLLPPGVVPLPSWTPYPVPNPVMSPTNQSAAGTGQFYGITQLSSSTPAYSGPYQAITSAAGPSSSTPKEHSYPQRPGQPECQYYLKTGDCKFGSSCKYHHPAEWVVPETISALSPMGLPLRPGTPTCSYYAQHGVCKFGPTCKFDHPMGTLSYSPSASSLSDMPVAPYPVGSSIGTLAPSSSSSDLRAEVISISNKDSPPVSVTISSGSGGSVSSKSGSISQSAAPRSALSRPASTSSTDSAAGHGVLLVKN